MLQRLVRCLIVLVPVAVLPLLLCPAASAQLPPGYVPTPDALEREFGRMSWAASFDLPQRTEADDHHVALRFKGTGGRWNVRVSVKVGLEGHYIDWLDDQVFRTAYRPTAVCAADWPGDRFFVAGWDGPRGRPVFEEWTVGPVDARLEGDPSAEGRRTTTADPPAITHRRLDPPAALTGHVAHIQYLAELGQLFVLEYGESPRLHAWDLTTGVVDTLTETELPELASVHGLYAGFHDVLGAYLIVYIERRSGGCTIPIDVGARRRLILRDGDVDGRFESRMTVTRDEWARLRASS